jgi:hypothetical protein
LSLDKASHIDKVRTPTRYETGYSMPNTSLIPVDGDVAILTHSESESDDGLTCVVVDSGEESDVEGVKLTGFIAFDENNTDRCESENKNVDMSTTKEYNTDSHSHAKASESFQHTATVTPKNREDAEHNEIVRNEVVNTCQSLLMKLETVRLSVLHLQYSMHAGELASVQVETVDRSSRLWNWDSSAPSSDIFKFDVANELKLSDQDFSELEVFGVESKNDKDPTALDTNLDTNLDNNLDNNLDTDLHIDLHNHIVVEDQLDTDLHIDLHNHIVVEDQLDPNQDKELDHPIETSINNNIDAVVGCYFNGTASTGCF